MTPTALADVLIGLAADAGTDDYGMDDLRSAAFTGDVEVAIIGAVDSITAAGGTIPDGLVADLVDYQRTMDPIFRDMLRIPVSS